MKTSLPLTFPLPQPVLDVRVGRSARSDRAQSGRGVRWPSVIIFVFAAIAAGEVAWFVRLDAPLLAQPQILVVPCPALTFHQWMAFFNRG